jgi:hypothetical protein
MTSIKRIGTGIAVVLALGGGAAPAASARNFDITSNGSYIQVPTTATPAPSIVRVDESAGFDWTDAGLGVAGGLALGAIGVGGALAVSQRRRAA